VIKYQTRWAATLAAGFVVGLAWAGTASAQGKKCEEGCTPGYWRNHPERWDGVDDIADFTNTVVHTDSFNATFGVDISFSGLDDAATLLVAVAHGGGAPFNLGRHAAAGLASADAGICYPYSTSEVIDIYRDGIGADDGPLSLEEAKDLLESANELGCPLSNDPPDDRYCFGDNNDCPCGNDLPGTGCINSTGGGGSLDHHAGSTSVTLDDLELAATGLPPNELVLFIMGIEQIRFPFGDGLQCVGAGTLKIFRFLPAAPADGAGTAILGPGIVDFSCTMFEQPIGCIQPGDTWNFQTWYRDPAGPCGQMFNLTNAIQVPFVL